MSEGKLCHGDLEASHKELEIDKHSQLFRAWDWGQLCPQGKRLEMEWALVAFLRAPGES